MVVVAIKTLQALSDLYNKNKFYGSKKESGKESCKEGSQEGCEEGSSKEEGRKEDSKACLIANLQLFFQKRSITPMMLLFFLIQLQFLCTTLKKCLR